MSEELRVLVVDLLVPVLIILGLIMLVEGKDPPWPRFSRWLNSLKVSRWPERLIERGRAGLRRLRLLGEWISNRY